MREKGYTSSERERMMNSIQEELMRNGSWAEDILI